MFQTKVVEKIYTHFLCTEMCFEDRAVYEIMWKNIVQPARPQVTIWSMRIICLRLQTHTQNMWYLLLFHCN